MFDLEKEKVSEIQVFNDQGKLMEKIVRQGCFPENQID